VSLQKKQVPTELSWMKKIFDSRLYDFCVWLRDQILNLNKITQELLIDPESGVVTTAAPAIIRRFAIGCTFGDGATDMDAPLTGKVRMPAGEFTVVGWSLHSNDEVNGDAEVDVRVGDPGSYPTTVSIIGAGTNVPLLIGQKIAASFVISSWDTLAISGGQIVEFDLTDIATIKSLTFELFVEEEL
jgi:hypothetical protein